MSSRDTSDLTDWSIARFEDCTVYRRRRELLVGGIPQPLEPRAFDVLVYLIQERHRVVSKTDILSHCWGDPNASEGALARSLMKVRQAIGDFDSKAPLIKTIHRVGYRFVGRLEFESAHDFPPAPNVERAEQLPWRRLVLLPFVNATHDDQLDWIELGLMSLVSKALQSLRDVSVVTTKDVLAALDNLAGPMTRHQKRQALRFTLESQLIAWGEVTGGYGRFLLHFNLEAADGTQMHGAATGSDLARIATQAALRMRKWLAPSEATASTASFGDKDEFVRQAFTRALSKAGDNRLTEAEHLLDVVRDSGARAPAFMREYARVQALLGRDHALAEVQALEQMAMESGDLHSKALSHFLCAILQEQLGNLPGAVAASRQAIETAESAGLEELVVEFMLKCAAQLAECLDDSAEAMLSRVIARAERLGNRVLLLDAYVAAGLLAGLRNDVLSCLAHTESAVALVPQMEESLQSMPHAQLGWVQMQLGQLDSALESTRIAFNNAEACGRHPELGIAGAAAAQASLAGLHLREAMELHGRMQAHAGDRSLAMLYAREVALRSTFLRAAGHFDAALECIAPVRVAARNHPVIEGQCDKARLHVLLQARRFDELARACAALRESTPRDRRLVPWIEHAMAFVAYLAHGDAVAALERMHEAMRSTPVCEANARISLDAAWLHLERGEIAQARSCVEHLQNWLEQSPEGRMVDARLCHASGDPAGAIAVQRLFCKQYAVSLTRFQQRLLSIYERSLHDEQDIPIAPLAEPLFLHWCVPPGLLPGA